MLTDDALQLLRRHDPARQLEPIPSALREQLRDRVIAIAAAQPAGDDTRRAPRRRTFTLLAAGVTVLVVGVGVAWAAGVLSPRALFENNLQQQGAAPGGLWDQRVVPASVVEAASVKLPVVGTVEFWYARSREGGWCGALRLPSGSWVGTGADSIDGGGTVPGCYPTREAVNGSTAKPVYVIDGFDYEEGDVDARAHGGSFWRVRYGKVAVPGAVRVADTVSGRSAPLVHGDLFALALPDPNPDVGTKVHLVAYDAAGKIVGDNCPNCGG